jgi:hypothetical protein
MVNSLASLLAKASIQCTHRWGEDRRPSAGFESQISESATVHVSTSFDTHPCSPLFAHTFEKSVYSLGQRRSKRFVLLLVGSSRPTVNPPPQRSSRYDRHAK